MTEKFMESPQEGFYSKTVMSALQEVLGVDAGRDIASIRMEYSLDEIFDAVLVYEGILGYSGKLVAIVNDIFNVNLLTLDA